MKKRTLNILVITASLIAISLWAGCKEEVPEPELPTVSIAGATVFEGNDNPTFSFQVVASIASEEEISIDYATEEKTAEAGVDFTSTSGTLVIPAGSREGTITVEVLSDTLKESDEDFKVILSNPVNATIQTPEGIGTIRNDDSYVFVPADGYITPNSYFGFDLAWSDEFDGTELNLDNWTHEIGAGGWGNNELQHYTDRTENSSVADGRLTIEARKESFSGAGYTSARLITLDKQEFRHGRIDIRAILPEGQGIWPALWMLGANFTDVGWPACGEIDIMEMVGHEPSTTHGTAHWGPQGQGFSTYQGDDYRISGEKFSEAYHVFSLIWEPGSIKWLVDDNEFFKITTANVSGNYPFNGEFFFIFNIAVGGQWPGSPDATTVFPQQMHVDYVRIFQEK